MSVFMDTFAFIASINKLDAAHTEVIEYLATCPGPIITTEWVLLEFADAFSQRNSRIIAGKTIQRTRQDPKFFVVPYDEAIANDGFKLYMSRPDKDWSLTDCISFCVMTSFGLTDALTADQHFEQAGFRAIFKKF